MSEFIHVSEGKERYHYVDSGLDNIWLIGGVDHCETTYGPATSIHDLDTLHRAIAMGIIDSPSMTGQEFRFLRIELELSQRALARLIKSSEQQIHRWENGKTKDLPGTAQVALAGYYLEAMDPNSRMKDLLERMAELDVVETTIKRRLFELSDDYWFASEEVDAA